MKLALVLAGLQQAAACELGAKVGNMRLYVCSESIFRVTHTPTETFPDLVSLIAKEKWDPVITSLSESDEAVTVATGKMKAVVDKKTEIVSFFDAKTGKAIVSEMKTQFNATNDMGKDTYIVEQQWSSADDEALYGGGQFQNGLLNFKNAPVQLVQYNTEAIVPFFVSSRGYGLLWDNYAWSYLNPAEEALDVKEWLQDSHSVANGASIGLRGCDGNDWHQHWSFNDDDRTLRLTDEESKSKLINIDYPNNDVHVWSRDGRYDGNQQWTVNGSLLVNSAQQVCLKASSAVVASHLTMATCDATDPLQQWRMDQATGTIALHSSMLRGSIALRAKQEEGDLAGALCLTADPKLLPSGVSKFSARTSGTHHFYIDACPHSFGCKNGKTLKLWIERSHQGTTQEIVVEWDQLNNMPSSLTGRAELRAGETYSIYFAQQGFSGIPSVLVQRPDYGRTTLRSMLGDLVDYYFAWGSDAGIDGAIAGYREITGAAPLYASWAYGFWQCREHYATQPELLEAAHGYRNRSIPVDNIVQDWHYWGNLGWGPQWDPAFYADPAGMVKELKGMNMQLMVSVWSKFDKGTSMFQTMTDRGQMLNGTNYYDAWNAEAREQFYQFSKSAHFDIGVDALWLDATEPEDFTVPEDFPTENHNTALGSGNALMNSYSLMTTKAISDGLRRDFADAQGSRVFSLTRSAFAAQQSTGAALWSGDISGAWDSLRRQVAASLNYQLSGMPYWSQDLGGFRRPADQYTSQDYKDMLVRWFQFGVFTPIYRVHGGRSHTELWQYGDDVLARLNSTNNLRYRFLPYTYSGFHRVEAESYTMQRALPMEFEGVASVADEFMWGSSLLVAPIVTQADNLARNRAVILPKVAGDWINFWTGASVASGTLQADAPIEHSPLFVRAGSVLPLGPYVQHTAEKPAELEVRIYPGADGSFSLYEDDGKSRDYQAGAASVIDFTYTEGTSTLFVAERKGSFKGMLQERPLKIVVVREGKGHGLEPETSPDQAVVYKGAKLSISLKQAAYV